MKAWILAPAAFSLALCSPEDCTSGSCGPRTSLLQLKSLSQTRETLAAGSGSSTSAALAGFQKFTDEMIAKYGKGDDKSLQANSSELQAVNTILAFLDDMYSTFHDAHLDAKQKGDECYSSAYHTHCPFDWTVYREFEDQWRGSISDHWHCRLDALGGCKNPPPHCEIYDIYRIWNEKAKMPNCIRDGAFDDDTFSVGDNQLTLPLGISCHSGYTHGVSPFEGCYAQECGYHGSSDCTDYATICAWNNATCVADGADWRMKYILSRAPRDALNDCEQANYKDGGGSVIRETDCFTDAEVRKQIWEGTLQCGGTEVTQIQANEDSTGCSWNAAQCQAKTDVRNKVGSQAFVTSTVPPAAQPPPTVATGSSEHATFYYGADYEYTDNCKTKVWEKYLAHNAQVSISGSADLAADAEAALDALVSGSGSSWSDASVSVHDDTIKTILEAIGLWDDTAAPDTNCGRYRTVYTGVDAVDQNQFSPFSAWHGPDDIVAQPAGKSCYCARVSSYRAIPMPETPSFADTSCNDYGTDKTRDSTGNKNLCFYKSYQGDDHWNRAHADPSLRQTNGETGVSNYHDGREDLFWAFATMPGFQDKVCGTNSRGDEHAFFRRSAYIHESEGDILKLKAFEDCLDVTFDWLYGPSEVTDEQKAYIRTREGGGQDLESQATHATYQWGSHYATGQHMSALGGRGRAAINSLYGDDDNTWETTKWFDKLNGKWKDPVDSQGATISSFNAAPETVVSGTEQYSKMAWSRRAWATATGAWSPGNFPSSSSQWGLWQRYVHCELSESRTREKLLDEGTFDGGDGMSAKRETGYLDAITRDTLGVQRVDAPTGGWTSGGGRRHRECRGCPSGNPSCTEEEKVQTECVDSNPVYQWKAEDHDDDITVKVEDHCAYIHHNDTHVERHCNDNHDTHRHVRCWDFYVMCSALQKRSESAYREWKTYREDECDMQEKCLTGFGRAVEVYNTQTAQTRDQAYWGNEKLAISSVNTIALQKNQDVRRVAIESRLAICSETCAIEHENALAREADNETAERLKCMLKALFGSLKTDAGWSPSDGLGGGTLADHNEACSATSDCRAELQCTNVTGDAGTAIMQCKDISYYWDVGASVGASESKKLDRREALKFCSAPLTWKLSDQTTYKHHDSWKLDQIECPSWDAGKATKQWWETKDNTLTDYTSAQISPAGPAYNLTATVAGNAISNSGTSTTRDPGQADNGASTILLGYDDTDLPPIHSQVTNSATDNRLKCLTREGCGLAVITGCPTETAICNVQCDAKKTAVGQYPNTVQEGCPDGQERGWELMFLTSEWWNTHDVCHLDWADHKGDFDTITQARVASDDGVKRWATTTTWGKTNRDGVRDWCNNGQVGYGETEYPKDNSTVREVIYDLNWGRSVNAQDIFPYMTEDHRRQTVQDWWQRHISDASVLNGFPANLLTEINGSNVYTTEETHQYYGACNGQGHGPDCPVESTVANNGMFMRTWPHFNHDSGTNLVKYCSNETDDPSITPNDSINITNRALTFDDAAGGFISAGISVPADKMSCWKQRANHMVVDDESTFLPCVEGETPFWVVNPPP